ncbi:hypothetical protein [Amycolatopsis magusensis]|uniref:hypothetical protein n=1 Tax=Amycolatopsis magusensis TaxID=882444 RepID=UPI0024A851C7|nr:hypothetical protein [Amycolatopsis magusensis]MDI5974676.1 hypothetical protein [Amycolatopsis magusensis]
MADQRGEEHPGAEVEPARRADPTPPADPEQLRQFQQFQQFQEFLKFSEAQKAQGGEVAQQPGSELSHQPLPQPNPQPPLPQPSHQPGGELSHQPQWQPPPPPRPKVPRWLTWIGKKLLGWLILLLLLALAATWAYNHFFPGEDEDLPAPEAGRGTYSATELLQPNPYRAVQLVYQQIAQNRPDLACGNLAKPAQAKFAADLGFADCEQAVNQLSTEVTNKTQYAQSIPFNRSGELPGDVFVIDSCDYDIKGGGRALGVFTVERQKVDASGAPVKGEQWLITGHEAGPNPCPGVKPSVPPSN